MSRSPASRSPAQSGTSPRNPLQSRSPGRPHTAVSMPKGFAAMSKKVADIIVETLQSAGVRHCYGVVGDTLNLIAHAISESAIEWVGMRHEEAGAFAAQGEALLTGN